MLPPVSLLPFVCLSRWTVKRRLEELANEEVVERKKLASGRVVWWIDDESVDTP